MAFEPLETDEKLEGPVQKQRDMDTAMLFGCSGFVFTSIFGYILSVWPFFIFPETNKLTMLLTATAIGLTPAAILGMFATRNFGLAGACGFVGGSMATGIFLYLRIDQIFLAALARQAPPAEYPQIITYLLPLAWVLVSGILALAVLPHDEE
jgi:hypothetical protein